MNIIKSLKWRYATKSFNPEKKIGPADLGNIMEAVRLSASSYGLQPYKVLVIENADLREQLKPASWNQQQITEASHLFVFCNKVEGMDEIVDEYVQLKTDVLGLEPGKLEGYGSFVKTKLGEKSESARADWTARQAYIALGNLMTACAELGIDACPMEGFEAEKYAEILNLKEQGLEVAVVAAVGYRSTEDATQHADKVRKPADELFEVF